MGIDVELTIKNYRCFSEKEPVCVAVRNGFTAFVGINNAGKSSLLRFFYDLRPAFGQLGSLYPLAELCNIRALQAVVAFGPVDTQEVFYTANDHDIEIQMRWQIEDGSPGEALFSHIRLSLTIPRRLGNNTVMSALFVGKEQVQENDLEPLEEDTLFGEFGDKYRYKGSILDLSPLRETFLAFTRTLYVGPFRNALSVASSNAPYFDIAVGQSFIGQWRSWLTGPSRQENETAHRVVEQLGRIFGFSGLQIHASHDGTKLQMFVDGKSYSMDQFGSGLTQFFLILAHAAMRRPAFVLIDEPELNLHPSLQLDFLTTLASYTTHGILFATHTLGLARTSANSIYWVYREAAHGQSRVVLYEDVPRLAELLGEMSFSGFRETGFDALLLVEGITEVTTLQQFLRFYGKDHRVVLLPMGGAQMIHGGAGVTTQLEEVKRITPHVFALIDSERSNPDAPLSRQRSEFVEVCKRLGIMCHVLAFRAMENYLTDRAVKKVMGPSSSALGPYEKRSATCGWGKTENWRIAREMSREELDKTDLGQFLSDLRVVSER